MTRKNWWLSVSFALGCVLALTTSAFSQGYDADFGLAPGERLMSVGGVLVMPTEATATQAPIQQQQPRSTFTPVRSVGRGVVNVLATLNRQRARQGIGGLVYDPSLQAVAERRVSWMAARGYKNHPPGSFAPGRYEGVGWSSSFNPSGVSACFTSDPRMRAAGAAMATGRDGVYFAVVYR